MLLRHGFWVARRCPTRRTSCPGHLRPFEKVAVNVDGEDFQQSDPWLCCQVKASAWEESGDETSLAEILRMFLSWAGEPA
jgi:hypothetical protein